MRLRVEPVPIVGTVLLTSRSVGGSYYGEGASDGLNDAAPSCSITQCVLTLVPNDLHFGAHSCSALPVDALPLNYCLLTVCIVYAYVFNLPPHSQRLCPPSVFSAHLCSAV